MLPKKRPDSSGIFLDLSLQLIDETKVKNVEIVIAGMSAIAPDTKGWSSWEIDNAAKMKRSDRRMSFLLGRSAARQALKSIWGELPMDLSIENAERHNPIVKSGKFPRQNISISHKNNLAVAAAFEAGFYFGIDLEEINCTTMPLLMEFMTSAEKLSLQGCPPHAAYSLAIFSAKEALSKLTTLGFQVPFLRYEINEIKVDGSGLEVTTSFKNFPGYIAKTYIGSHFVISFAFPNSWNIQFRNLNPFQVFEKINDLRSAEVIGVENVARTKELA
jgi:4'-phosphopantetheinyl transferase EntD